MKWNYGQLYPLLLSLLFDRLNRVMISWSWFQRARSRLTSHHLTNKSDVWLMNSIWKTLKEKPTPIPLMIHNNNKDSTPAPSNMSSSPQTPKTFHSSLCHSTSNLQGLESEDQSASGKFGTGQFGLDEAEMDDLKSRLESWRRLGYDLDFQFGFLHVSHADTPFFSVPFFSVPFCVPSDPNWFRRLEIGGFSGRIFGRFEGNSRKCETLMWTWNFDVAKLTYLNLIKNCKNWHKIVWNYEQIIWVGIWVRIWL